jgi:hypothetical protein
MINDPYSSRDLRDEKMINGPYSSRDLRDQKTILISEVLPPQYYFETVAPLT